MLIRDIKIDVKTFVFLLAMLCTFSGNFSMKKIEQEKFSDNKEKCIDSHFKKVCSLSARMRVIYESLNYNERSKRYESCAIPDLLYLIPKKGENITLGQIEVVQGVTELQSLENKQVVCVEKETNLYVPKGAVVKYADPLEGHESVYPIYTEVAHEASSVVRISYFFTGILSFLCV